MRKDVNKSRLLNITDLEQTNKIALVGRALSSPIRIEILRLLNEKPMLASEIAEKFDLQLSSVLVHMKILEDAELVIVEQQKKGKRIINWYTYALPKIVMIMRQGDKIPNNNTPPVIYNINIGDFIDGKFNSSCGFASESMHLNENTPNEMFAPSRRNAQVIWNKHDGYITYAVPNNYANNKKLNNISFSMEICSETNGYNNEFPSDITFSINDVELCTWTCPGDFGDRYGIFTPPWWFRESTKYGLLTTVAVQNDGVYLNKKLVNKNVKLQDLNLSDGNKTTFKIEVKKNAINCGGFNIFGEKFGDYNQAIIFTAIYDR